jgi:D-3-phosphoglycerate dehydrogenase / 2-oxoglutarate reductase
VAVVVGLGRFDQADATPYPQLRTVARYGAGYDNVDVKGLWDAGRIFVSCTANLSNRDVAELALAMTILALRDAPRDVASLSSDNPAWRVIGRGVSLSDATIGVVGCGNIGLEFARLVMPLASKILLWNRSRRALPLETSGGARYEVVGDLDELAARSDAISVHLALTPGTHGIIGSSFFQKLRSADRSIALVNTSRGNVVDEVALLEALNDGSVRAAAIDVWSAEGGAAATETVRALRSHPAVLPTSHIGAHTTGVLYRYAMQCAQNIVATVEGRPGDVSQYIVDPA